MKTVLVVDDEFALLEALATLLLDEGYRVLTASNGQQALERMAEERPHLVLTDWMMPLMDGLKLISTLRADPGYASVPILLMSAVDAAKTRTQHPDVPFIQKPFDVDDLVTRVRELVHAAPPPGEV